VFDAAMLVALPEVPKEELVAGLLVFRMLYFLLPFCLALITMACWETMLFLHRGRVAAGDRTTETSGKPAAHEDTSPHA
jgi:hypothetical protein